MKIRVGIEGGRKPVIDRAKALHAPVLVSANSLWNNKRQRFGGWSGYDGLDVALDSGGFIAMKQYGGYRWSIEQYAGLARVMAPTWWAQMDFCCEPEIASNRREVYSRIDRTAEHLHQCARQNVPGLMPVLQGWEPADYCQGPIFSPGYDWPALVGIGSVCRREVKGPNGIVAVVAALDKVVPRPVRFHLFGVKSEAIETLLADYAHRVESMDSMAWNMAARWKAYTNKTPCNGNDRADAMESWYLRQRERVAKPKQMTLTGL